MNLKNLTPVADQPGIFEVAKSGARVRLESPDGTPFVLPAKDDKSTPPTPAAPAAAVPPAPAAPPEPAKAEPDAFTAARSRVDAAITPLVPEKAPSKEELERLDPYRQARTRMAHGLYGDTK
jgi:protein TonB